MQGTKLHDFVQPSSIFKILDGDKLYLHITFKTHDHDSAETIKKDKISK